MGVDSVGGALAQAQVNFNRSQKSDAPGEAPVVQRPAVPAAAEEAPEIPRAVTRQEATKGDQQAIRRESANRTPANTAASKSAAKDPAPQAAQAAQQNAVDGKGSQIDVIA